MRTGRLIRILVNYNTVSLLAGRCLTFPSAGICMDFHGDVFPSRPPARESERKSLGFTDFLTEFKRETFYPEKADANC